MGEALEHRERLPRARRGAACLVAASLAVHACSGTPKPSVATAPGTDTSRLVAALRSKIPDDPIPLQGDPYRTWRGRTPTPAPAGAVCGVAFEADRVHYRLATFPGEGEARSAGFAVTHVGACGTCSTLQDLAVYLERPDLTAPVRHCGIMLDDAASLDCIERLGFSDACARTWYFNARNTRHECFRLCVVSWAEGEPPTRPDGRLNACLQCDEDRSGPVFKVTAGRTRRNSGIRSSIPRPDEDVAHVVHDYVPGAEGAR